MWRSGSGRVTVDAAGKLHVFANERAGQFRERALPDGIGKSLALALEFELGADILKTAVAPSIGVIAQLAAIAGLRTFLNYFLERELRSAEQRRERQEQMARASQEDAPVSTSTRRGRTEQ